MNARLHLRQALTRRRLAKRDGLTASMATISEAHAAIERTTRCAVAKLEEYREMRVARDAAERMVSP